MPEAAVYLQAAHPDSVIRKCSCVLQELACLYRVRIPRELKPGENASLYAPRTTRSVARP